MLAYIWAGFHWIGGGRVSPATLEVRTRAYVLLTKLRAFAGLNCFENCKGLT